MEFKIEEKPAFYLVGVTQLLSIQEQGDDYAMQVLAESITENQKEEMYELTNLYPMQEIHAKYTFTDSQMKKTDKQTHMIGVPTTKKNPFDDLEQVVIPNHTWAIFPSEGPYPDALQATREKIYSEWRLSAHYEMVSDLELSFTEFDEGLEDYYSEIWVAVREKQV